MNSEQKVSQMILDVAGQFILMVESEEERQTQSYQLKQKFLHNQPFMR